MDGVSALDSVSAAVTSGALVHFTSSYGLFALSQPAANVLFQGKQPVGRTVMHVWLVSEPLSAGLGAYRGEWDFPTLDNLRSSCRYLLILTDQPHALGRICRYVYIGQWSVSPQNVCPPVFGAVPIYFSLLQLLFPLFFTLTEILQLNKQALADIDKGVRTRRWLGARSFERPVKASKTVFVGKYECHPRTGNRSPRRKSWQA